MTNTETAGSLKAEPVTIDGKPAFRVPLAGRDGAGKFALVDAEGLARLKDAGARALYLVGDGHCHRYVTFLRLPTYHCAMAARTIIDAPQGRRVIYHNGDRLDLRSANLTIQPRMRERRSPSTFADMRSGWSAHGRFRRQSERMGHLA